VDLGKERFDPDQVLSPGQHSPGIFVLSIRPV
jgi:hypothetical protein